MTSLRVTDVHLNPAADADRATGFLGHISCIVNDLRVCLALRRTRGGRYSISLPRQRGRVVVCPTTPEATRALEAQVLAALGLENAP